MLWPPCSTPPTLSSDCSHFRQDEDNEEMSACSLMLYSLWRLQKDMSASSAAHLLLPSPPHVPTLPQIMIDPTASPGPTCHLFFFFIALTQLFFFSLTAWYSGVGMHAPSQIHQLRSECRTTARVNRGMRGGERERRQGGGREKGAGQWLVDILPGPKS